MLLSDEPAEADDTAAERNAEDEAAAERRIGLNEQRIGSVLSALRSAGARSVVDLGCGEGRLVRALLDDKLFERILGVDVSHRVLERAHERLRLDGMPGRAAGALWSLFSDRSSMCQATSALRASTRPR